MSGHEDKARVSAVRILLLEDTASDADLIEIALTEAGMDFVSLCVETGKAFSQALDDFHPDIILSDFNLPSFDGRTALAMVQKRCPATPMIMVTGAIGDELAVELLKAGARDYILKDRLIRLPSAVRRALAEARETRQRQAAEQSLRESEEKFRTMTASAQDAIILTDSNAGISFWNAAAERIFGYPNEAALGEELFGLVAPEHLASDYRAMFVQLRDAGSNPFAGNTVELTARRHDGVEFPIEVSISALVFGHKWHAIAIARDISERKAMELALRASEQEFRSLADNLPDLVVRYDLECRRTYVNPAFEQGLEIPMGEALNVIPDARWRGSISALEYRAQLRQVMATGTPVDMTLSWMRPTDGSTIHQAMRIVAERAPNGRIKGALAIGRTITALVEAKQQLEESRTQLRALAARREAAREEERRRIARELHDELGQQLSALRFGVSLIDYRFGDEQPHIRAATAKLLDMVDKTIQVTRDVSSSLRPGVLDMGIVPALEWLTEEFSRHTGISCELKVLQGEIQIDEELGIAIFRIAQESLTNAARHAKAASIQITFKCDAGAYVLEVKDDGVGFDVAAPRKKTSFGLVGIHERVIATGGEVLVSSAPGCGTVVSVHIPMVAAKKDES
jgi:PAS domain S-box-containing protein